ncbi:protein-L-isoaspartate(D-aspartate) O-methyltransferase [Novosphingobium bradum]|uniref:Protein-L-isoaspartate O-methyltransferase n=1 Tax=Novosphingobium bradum TaxID=1737444 RepID=A0ABV7IYX0_9SPHN
MTDQAEKRRRMVESQLAARGVRDPRVLEAMGRVPREVFVPESLREYAYDDTPLPIEAGQTISQPWIVAVMIEAAAIQPGDLVLEVGAGSGYAAAVLGEMGAEVVAIERHEALVRLARERMLLLGYRNVDVEPGDGSQGRPGLAPFAAILVAAGGPRVPEPLLAQLAVGGHLIMPVGEADEQVLCKVTRTGADSYETQPLGAVRFVPLIGAHGRDGAGPGDLSAQGSGGSR